MKTRILLISFFILNFFQVNAQSNDEVTLIVSADGVTKEEAIKVALRSAIEQAYGTFVSANTTLLNDELVKDEIVTISNGNIKEYKELASMVLPNGNQSVTLQATVCVSKLVSYVQSKGASTEFAGQTLMMNLKLNELYKNNEKIAIQNMLDQLASIQFLFDTELAMEDPIIKGNDVLIKCAIILKYNENLDAFNKIALSTITSLDQSNKKKSNWKMDKELGLCHSPYLNLNFTGNDPRVAVFRNKNNFDLTRSLMEILKNDFIKLTIKANTGETVFSGKSMFIESYNYKGDHECNIRFDAPNSSIIKNFRRFPGCYFFYDRNTLRVFKYGYDYKGIRDLTNKSHIPIYPQDGISYRGRYLPVDYVGELCGIVIKIPKNEISKYSNFYVEYNKE